MISFMRLRKTVIPEPYGAGREVALVFYPVPPGQIFFIIIRPGMGEFNFIQ